MPCLAEKNSIDSSLAKAPKQNNYFCGEKKICGNLFYLELHLYAYIGVRYQNLYDPNYSKRPEKTGQTPDQMSQNAVRIFGAKYGLFVCVEVLRPSQPNVHSVYLTTRLLGRLSPLSG